MNSDYYFQKGLRLIVTGVVVLALIILFCGMVSQGFPLWLALVLLVPAGLGVVGFYFFIETYILTLLYSICGFINGRMRE